MHLVNLIHTGEQVDLRLLMAVCDALAQAWRGTPIERIGAMPVYTSHSALPARLAANPGYAYSFDVACRLVSKTRNTAQASNQFFDDDANRAWFVKTEPLSEGIGGAPVYCVQFTPACMQAWLDNAASAEGQAIRARADALVEADVESAAPGEATVIVAIIPVAQHLQSTLPVPLPGAALTRAAAIRMLADDIAATPHQARYRKQAAGAASRGWDQRLAAYFWPNPRHDYASTLATVKPLEQTASALARALQAGAGWDTSAQREAVSLANAIFSWGGVPQRPETVDSASVQAVFEAALANRGSATARMNSGWTKVAAFASAHLEGMADGMPQVIWDSRVATALIARLDAILAAHGLTDPGTLFAGIGTVPGRGGSRPRSTRLRWPSGYASWAAQTSGSALVRELRDVLNSAPDKYARMPMPASTPQAWTTRGVEMVLFMDGY